MSALYDVIVVGSGPAGVSAAFPLVEAGLRVLLVDGGREMTLPAPSSPYLTGRLTDERQWEWMVGRDYSALQNVNTTSPKLRAPTNAYVFDGFKAANKIETQDFIAIGSLARGGLSNAWGCGVARLSNQELSNFPFSPSAILPSYEAVTRRIGISGAISDDLSDYFGLDEWGEPPIRMDTLHSRILDRYVRHKSRISAMGLVMGRSRVAALVQDRGERKACDLSGNCLWGCHRRALYSSTEDLTALKRYSNFTYKSGFIVDEVINAGEYRAIGGKYMSGYHTLTAGKIILAAGTLATTRLALRAINFYSPITMQSCPTAAFMLWLPAATGTQRAPAFGLGQLSFVLSLKDGVSGFGSLFNTTGIPVAEFAKHIPLQKRYGIDLLKGLLSSCVVGNIFLPGHLSMATLSISANDGVLRIKGGYHPEVRQLMELARRRLQKAFWKSGAILLPGSFTVGHPGSDIHYASSLQMRTNPVLGETNSFGELFGFDDVYIADGACLSLLTEKSHTLTIMANADRIGRKLAKELVKR